MYCWLCENQGACEVHDKEEHMPKIEGMRYVESNLSERSFNYEMENICLDVIHDGVTQYIATMADVYLHEMETRGYAKLTLERDRSVLRGFLEFCRIGESIWARMRQP